DPRAGTATARTSNPRNAAAIARAGSTRSRVNDQTSAPYAANVTSTKAMKTNAGAPRPTASNAAVPAHAPASKPPWLFFVTGDVRTPPAYGFRRYPIARGRYRYDDARERRSSVSR